MKTFSISNIEFLVENINNSGLVFIPFVVKSINKRYHLAILDFRLRFLVQTLNSDMQDKRFITLKTNS